MHDINSLKNRYVAMNGHRRISNDMLRSIQAELGLVLPLDFMQITEFYDGSGFNVLPLYSLAGNAPKMNPVNETLRLRESVQLPSNWLVLGEPPESLLLMDCANGGKVLWLDAVDVARISSNSFNKEPETWDSFSDFFDYLLEEEEADRS